MSTPAGWYPQPDGQQRYWDGESWTENFAPGGPPVIHPAAARKNWFLRHKALTAVGAVLLLVIIAAIAGIAGGGGNKSVNIAPAAQAIAPSSTPDQAALVKAAADQAAADKAASDAAAVQAGIDKRAADQAASDKAAADKAAADKAAADKAAADKAAADKAAADKAAAPAAEVFTMPSLVGQNLQLSQDKLQALGSYLMDQQDAAGLGRIQVIDSNWTVCKQDPAPGATVPLEAIVTLAAVKLAEQCP